MNVLITGAAGNLGSHLSKHIKDNEKDLNLILMQHRKKVPSHLKGSLNGNPISVHARTRLEEEIHLFSEIDHPISLRVGMVYGKGILMVDAAEWFVKRLLLGVWREPTQIHLISRGFKTKSPLTRDCIDIGRVSYYGDTSRFRSELLPLLKYSNINEGINEMTA